MRMMLKTQLEVQAASLAINDGSLEKAFAEVFAACQPEAVYFCTENGDRTVYAIFDMKDPSIIPVLAEPLFQTLGAKVYFNPVMVQPELETGIKTWAAKHH